MDTYEKKYKEALELARVAAFNGHQSLMEGIFPELKESEDEKIRKELIDIVAKSPITFAFEDKNKVLAWLEKQGELKSIWHNEDEEPKRDSLILLIMQSGTPIVAKIIEPNHTFNHGERWAYIDDLHEKQGQKPAWSEEDEHRVKDTIYFLDTAKKYYASTVELDACINWLKSFKQRIGG